MAKIEFFKLNAAPAQWLPNSVYFIRNGDGADQYVTDESGLPRLVGVTLDQVDDAIANATNLKRAHTHFQSTPQSTWVIVHNLGFIPGGVFVKDSANQTWTPAEIAHPDTNTTILSFGSISFSGEAYLS